MKLGKLYELIVKAGIEADPRPRAKVSENLTRARSAYRKLSGGKKSGFDKDSLSNPYADTRILHGDRSKDMQTIMVGIDMGGEELLLFDRLNQMGRSIDLVMGHHPQGLALTRLSHVMGMQADIMSRLGVLPDAAKQMMDERMKEVARSLHPRNYSRHVDIARLLDIPFMCCHTVADNHVTTFLQRFLDKARPKKLKDLVVALNRIPEYRDASVAEAGPKIIAGKPSDSTGKIFVDMTGGTEGSKQAFARLSQVGVKTIVGMHMSEANIRVAKKEYINVVIAGHIASDNIGMNMLLDKLSKAGQFEFICCSGFKRIER